MHEPQLAPRSTSLIRWAGLLPGPIYALAAFTPLPNACLRTLSAGTFRRTAPSLGVDPMRLVVPAAIAASMAFMLPVATPPNAIVFASRRITIGQMARAGPGLNIAGIIRITLATMIVGESIVSRTSK